MKQTGSLRVFLATALVASSIVAMKVVMPSTPLGATIVASAIGLALIFSLHRSDARRRRELAAETASAPVAQAPGDSNSIRRRLEGRPVPQVSPGPLSRDMNGIPDADPIFTPPAYGQDGPSYPDAPYTRPESPVLELVQPADDFPTAEAPAFEPVLELSENADWIDQPFEEGEGFKWGESDDQPVEEPAAFPEPASGLSWDTPGEEAFAEPAPSPEEWAVEPEPTAADFAWGRFNAEEALEPPLTETPAPEPKAFEPTAEPVFETPLSREPVVEDAPAAPEAGVEEPDVEDTAPAAQGLDWTNFESLSNPSAHNLPPSLVPTERAPEPEPVAGPCADPIATARANPVVFSELFPPRANDSLSFYGGLPVAPAGFAWPRAVTEEGEAPLTFIMQWECAGLAAQDATGMLPRDGVLYLFMDLDWSRPMAYRFVHVAGPAQGWAQVEVPEDLGPAYGSQAIWAWPMCAGADHDARGIVPRRLPHWAFDPVRLPVETDGATFWQKNDATTAALARLDGEFSAQPIEGWSRPYAAFPQDWSAVRMACAYLLDLMRQPDQPAEVTQWLDETRMLYAVASREEPFETIPQASADEMWGWMQMVRGGLEPVFPQIVTAAINATLGASGNAADLIPAGIIEKIAATHALAPLAAPNRIFGAPSYVQGQVEPFVESEVLLLELSGNDTLGHFFGTGVLQFTIAPEDLAAGNFDRVRMTVSAT